MKWQDAKPLAGMTPWACSYLVDGRRHAVTLHGTDPEQVLRDNRAALPGLRIDGELESTLSTQ